MLSFWCRLYKALPWFAMGAMAFYLIGVLGTQYQQEHQSWPQYPAEVLSSNIKWAAHMSDHYELSILLKVYPDNGAPSYQAGLLQAGPKGALEKRVNSIYATGSRILVRSNPQNPNHIELVSSIGWGAYLIGGIIFMVGVLFITVGVLFIIFIVNTANQTFVQTPCFNFYFSLSTLNV